MYVYIYIHISLGVSHETPSPIHFTCLSSPNSHLVPPASISCFTLHTYHMHPNAQ